MLSRQPNDATTITAKPCICRRSIYCVKRRVSLDFVAQASVTVSRAVRPFTSLSRPPGPGSSRRRASGSGSTWKGRVRIEGGKHDHLDRATAQQAALIGRPVGARMQTGQIVPHDDVARAPDVFVNNGRILGQIE